MSFTFNEFNDFFEETGQVKLSQKVGDQQALEGLVAIEDFVDFKQDQLTQAFCNMKTLITRVPAQPRSGRKIELPAIAPI